MEIRKAAIFGATGVTGRMIARELLGRHIAVRAVSRSEPRLAESFGKSDVEIRSADLREASAASGAAAGCGLIFHCVGLPYREFRDHPIIAEETATAIHDTGARCVLVSSYYAYEPVRPVPVREDAPREPDRSRRGCASCRSTSTRTPGRP